MNELAELVSDALTGNLFKTIELKDKFYTVYAPHTIVVARMLKPLSKIFIDEGSATSLSVIASIGEQSQYIAEVIALAILGDVPAFSLKYRFSLWRLKRKLQKNDMRILKEAFKDVLSLIDGQAFFDCAQLAMGITKGMAKQELQGETR